MRKDVGGREGGRICILGVGFGIKKMDWRVGKCRLGPRIR